MEPNKLTIVIEKELFVELCKLVSEISVRAGKLKWKDESDIAANAMFKIWGKLFQATTSNIRLNIQREDLFPFSTILLQALTRKE